jgi:hypothetical protein
MKGFILKKRRIRKPKKPIEKPSAAMPMQPIKLTPSLY